MDKRIRGCSTVLLALMIGACATMPGPEDPVIIRLDQLEARLNRIEQAVRNQAGMVGQVQGLEGDMRELRGSVEEVQHDLDGTSQRQRNLYIDVDGRLQKLESSASATSRRSRRPAVSPSPTVTTPTATSISGSDNQEINDRDAYQAAIALLREGHYQDASVQFEQFLGQYPDSQFSDNAQYWYGETFYVTRKFSEALAAFQNVVSIYPRSQKVPDALLKIGYCDYELGYWDAARAALTRVTNEYPDTTAAHLAQRRMEQMTGEGH
ncbi:MAG: tol-pal system protein YbgF [Proteobacteria bacterium]|nr:tol-pal system protein YbgF [Pseudomonadota bacterium]